MPNSTNLDRWDGVLHSLKHHYDFRSGSPEGVEALEARLGTALPYDLRYFYSHCDGVKLFRDFDAPFTIRNSSKVDYLGTLWGQPESNDDILAICNCQDSDHIGLRLFPGTDRYEIIDCWHEAYPDFSSDYVIGHCFLSFLEQLREGEGRKFWFKGRGTSE